MTGKFWKQFAGASSTGLACCCGAFRSKRTLDRITPDTKNRKRLKTFKSEVFEDDVRHLLAELLGVGRFERGAELAVGRLAPWGVDVGFGNAGAGGGEVFEDVALGSQPSCPFRSGAAIGTVLEVDEGDPPGNSVRSLRMYHRRLSRGFSIVHRMPRRERSMAISRTTS